MGSGDACELLRRTGRLSGHCGVALVPVDWIRFSRWIRANVLTEIRCIEE